MINDNHNIIIGTRIVLKSRTTVGYIRPEYKFENNFKVKKIEKEELKTLFPDEGSIVVHNNFQTDIEEAFDEDELFKIEYEKSKANYRSGYSIYQSLRGNASNVKKLPLIVDENINKIISEGEIYLPYQNHSYVFIKNNDEVYGPIAITQEFIEEGLNDNTDNYKYNLQSFTNTKEFDLSEDFEDVIHVFNFSTIEEYTVNSDFYEGQKIIDLYVTNIYELLKNNKPIRLLLNESNDKIIKKINSLFPNKEIDSSLLNGDLNEVNKLRLSRYLEIENKSKNWYEFISNNILPSYLKTDEGKKFVNEYFDNNKKDIIQSKIDEINRTAELKAKEEEKEINANLDVLKKDEKNIYDSIEIINSKKKALENELKELSDEIEIVKQKNEQLTTIEKELEVKKNELSLYIDIKAIKKEKEKLEKDRNEIFEKISELINDKKRYVNELEVVKKELRDGTNDIVEKRYKDLKPYFDLMNGTSINRSNENNFTPLDLEGVIFNQNDINLEDLIEEVDKFLQSKGRRYKKEDILNFIILYFQNLLIIFSGLPGIGKTSLSVLLSEFFTHKNCFLELAVSKGWNSRKVLLGYNNPISNTYQYDENGFVEKIIRYNSKPPLLPLNILLDEANLSPIEHYWSDFISIYDKDKNERILKIDLEEYKDKGLVLPSKLRFMATINNDHTTERLSPRLIDRAPIITIENDNTRFFETQNKIDYTFSGYYNFEELDKLLNPIDESLVSKEEDILIKVFNILKNEGSIAVSIRKMNSIKKYCNVSRELMSKYTANQYANIDYAIAQFILPQIQGQGVEFGNMLAKLIELFKDNQLSKSAKILKRIKDKGISFQVFSFFN
jgi:hypothetical protein